MFDPFERTVRNTLKQLAKQRVRMVMRPRNFRTIDNAGTRSEDTHASAAGSNSLTGPCAAFHA
jgi:hypothetical protein